MTSKIKMVNVSNTRYNVLPINRKSGWDPIWGYRGASRGTCEPREHVPTSSGLAEHCRIVQCLIMPIGDEREMKNLNTCQLYYTLLCTGESELRRKVHKYCCIVPVLAIPYFASHFLPQKSTK